MKRNLFVLLGLLPYMIALARSHRDEHASVCIHPTQEENRIDKHIYGFLLEHLYHSVSNGIWGENVWNRSFEELQAEGKWSADTNGHLTVNALDNYSGSHFNIARLKDGVLSLDIRSVKGEGCFLIGVRDQHRENLQTNAIWLHLENRDKKRHTVECHTGWIWHTPIAKVITLPTTDHGIDKEAWNHVEVECQGARIIIRLNRQNIFDQVIPDCPRDGAVTLGALGCKAEFRNIHVKGATGNDVPANLNLCRHWDMVGDCLSEIDDRLPLNHAHALCITNRGTWAGIEQEGRYYVRRDDVQRGSVFLKGNVPTVVARFVQHGQTLAEQAIELISSEWHEYPLLLPTRQDMHDVGLQLLTHDSGWFCVDQISLMHQSSWDNHGFRKELEDAVKDIAPTLLRWPGGSFVELYKFEDGLGPQASRRGIHRWDDFDPLSFGTDEFIEFCHTVVAEPQIVVPIGYHNYSAYAPDLHGQEDWLKRALDWLEYCNGDTTTTWGRKRALGGHPEPYGVKYWEIDNEVWKMDPHLYAQLTRIFSLAMKAKDPSIKIIGCGSGRLGAEGKGLDSIMIHEVGEYIDYVSPHHYQDINKFGNEGVEEYGRYLDQLATWIDSSRNPSMKIFLSEWNLSGTDMRTGLFAGGFLNRIERTPHLAMAAPALFLRHLSAPGWDNAFINFDQDRWFPAPNYVVMKLWREHYLPIRIAHDGNLAGLNISATRSENCDSLCVKIVNPGSKDISLDLLGISDYSHSTWEVVMADSLTQRNTLEVPDALRPLPRKVKDHKGVKSIVVPPYSASVLTCLR